MRFEADALRAVKGTIPVEVLPMTAEQKLSHGMICTIPFAVIRSLRGDVVKSLPALIVIKLRDRLGGELP